MFIEFYYCLNSVGLDLTGKSLNTSIRAFIGSNISIVRDKTFGGR